jgi:predicted CXXCH cytochrome family protein
MTTRMGQRGWWRSIAIVLGMLAASVVWLGCSPKKHYKVLSFFFDGVPDPNAPARGAPGQLDATGRVIMASVMHKPYQENRCDACHTSQNAFENLSTPTEESCLKCHDKVKEPWTFLHGPVAATQCLWCHDPHRSTVPSLLRHPAGKLCRECHTQELLDPGVPEHVDLTADCLQCHYGHGGNDRNFLKPGVLIAAPSTQPTTQSSTQPASDEGATP